MPRREAISLAHPVHPPCEHFIGEDDQTCGEPAVARWHFDDPDDLDDAGDGWCAYACDRHDRLLRTAARQASLARSHD